MEPRIVIVVGPSGIKVTRLVASNKAEEEACLSLYLKLRDTLNSIDQILVGNRSGGPRKTATSSIAGEVNRHSYGHSQ